jgi:signal transduction histidine kinase
MLLLALGGAVLLWRVDDAVRRDAFDTRARIAHRLLSQRALQHEAVLATLTLLQPQADRADDPVRRLPALLASVRQVLRRDGAATWDAPDLAAAEARSLSLQRAVLARVDSARGQAVVLRAGRPASFALVLDLTRVLGEPEWPVPQGAAIDVLLIGAGVSLPLQQAAPQAAWGRYTARKTLAAESQPFDLVMSQGWGWAELPWAAWALWLALVAGLGALAAAWQQQRQARQRAEELLRVGQVTRLNTLGELAGGIAHELNQPLTAVLANTQAALRLLDEDPPELATARQAMGQATAQARRASEVLNRLRRALQRPEGDELLQPVRLADTARVALHLLAPESRQLGLTPRVSGADDIVVQADPVALEQILHNLLRNALQSLAQVPPAQRSLLLEIGADSGKGHLTVRDSGEGIAPALAPRLFQPFASSREGGLGLGLSLSESLAQAQGGALVLWPQSGPGAAFRLSLPLEDGR